jgi:uncharacterized damage-inducible protein DinB
MLWDNNPLLESQIKFWRESVKPSLDKALDLSPEERLNWAPAENMISLGNIFLHISETSDWWFDEVMNKRQSVELVPTPSTGTKSKIEIKKYLDIHWERLERFFDANPEILACDYQYMGRSKTMTFSGLWIYTHLLEHDIHHRSQINQYLRILGIKPPEI